MTEQPPMTTIHFEDPAKRAIWATLRALNEAWTTGDPDGLADYFHHDMVAVTATDRDRLDGGADCIAAWKRFADAAHIHRWVELDPVIHVYGDAAVVAYYFDIAYDMDGGTMEAGGRDLFFFVKEDGRWWAVADQFSLYPG